jgi:hypothetical protein
MERKRPVREIKNGSWGNIIGYKRFNCKAAQPEMGINSGTVLADILVLPEKMPITGPDAKIYFIGHDILQSYDGGECACIRIVDRFLFSQKIGITALEICGDISGNTPVIFNITASPPII